MGYGNIDQAAQGVPIACTLAGGDRLRRGAEVAELFGARREVRELPDGYAVRFPCERMWAERLLAFIVAERECCPFFAFGLRFEPGLGPIWLHLCGPEGTADVVAALLGLGTDQDSARQASAGAAGDRPPDGPRLWP